MQAGHRSSGLRGSVLPMDDADYTLVLTTPVCERVR
jgi:hypothetical protein